MIKNLRIKNFRRFQDFELTLNDGMNVLVGDNDSGKTTVVEAINLALTGRWNGRTLRDVLSPYLFNQETTTAYVEALHAGEEPVPPVMVIELYFGENYGVEALEGSNNLDGVSACGVRIQAAFDPDYAPEYGSFVENLEDVRLVPTEYYKVEWLGFSGSAITKRSLPAAAAVIDAANIRLQSGVDYHLQNIINGQLTTKERVELSREYRSLRERFDERDAVQNVNKSLRENNGEISDRELSLSIDISQRYTWESSLVAHLDKLPMPFIGKGDQNTVKTLLAIGRHADDKQVVMIEEPETNLSFSRLRQLLERINKQCGDKQVIVTTHSAYVLNKLGLDATVLLGSSGTAVRISDLSGDTVSFFKRLPGHDTLRLVLASGAILVEGSSDELIVQRAYRDLHEGKEPLDDGRDVISVGTTHKRFMELARALDRRVWAVRDNDGRTVDEMKKLFDGFLVKDLITLHHPESVEQRTLEPAIMAANDLVTLNAALGTTYGSDDEAIAGMTATKTESALHIYESSEVINMPEYIRDVCR